VLVEPTSTPVLIADVAEEALVRHRTGIAPLDEVLGGGLVAGSVSLLGGDPGASKSTLVMTALYGLRLRCLYATGEESVAQVADRARRIGVASSRRLWVVAETHLETVLEHARRVRAEVVVIDSIQTLISYDASGSAGSPGQLRACATQLVRFAKSTDVACVVIGHVTKDGSLGGPLTLAHIVDVVLELEASAGDERLLRCASKNRFGPTNLVGRFTVTAAGLSW
jgi:DNA repair protein RadA/Sms